MIKEKYYGKTRAPAFLAYERVKAKAERKKQKHKRGGRKKHSDTSFPIFLHILPDTRSQIDPVCIDTINSKIYNTYIITYFVAFFNVFLL